jgi:hypothetical protein
MLYSYYFCFNLLYPVVFEKILVFFHEALNFEKKIKLKTARSAKYLKYLNSTK